MGPRSAKGTVSADTAWSETKPATASRRAQGGLERAGGKELVGLLLALPIRWRMNAGAAGAEAEPVDFV
jgi:hypothetical protein